jgi:hypothetical protein
MRICVRNLPPPRFFLANHSPLMPRERRSRPTAPGNGVKNGPRARQNPLLGAEFYPGAIPIEAIGMCCARRAFCPWGTPRVSCIFDWEFPGGVSALRGAHWASWRPRSSSWVCEGLPELFARDPVRPLVRGAPRAREERTKGLREHDPRQAH